MSKDFASMIKRLGSIVPGFKGYESREELRETDYKLRLHVSNQIEVLVRNIETSKLEMDDLNLMQMDKIQNELKVLAAQISNQTYGYKSMMHRENDDYLRDVISNDSGMVELLEAADLNDITHENIAEIYNELRSILLQRKELLS